MKRVYVGQRFTTIYLIFLNEIDNINFSIC